MNNDNVRSLTLETLRETLHLQFSFTVYAIFKSRRQFHLSHPVDVLDKPVGVGLEFCVEALIVESSSFVD